jgi:hypothetical protein
VSQTALQLLQLLCNLTCCLQIVTLLLSFQDKLKKLCTRLFSSSNLYAAAAAAVQLVHCLQMVNTVLEGKFNKHSLLMLRAASNPCAAALLLCCLQMVNFLLEDKLTELGGQLVRKPDWQPCVVTDGNLITGQNPASALEVGKTLLQQLKEKRAALGGVASGGVTFSAGEAGLVGGKAAAAAHDNAPAGKPTDAGQCC